MTGASRREQTQALAFAMIMIVSMIVAGVGGLAGSAAANLTGIEDIDAEDVSSETTVSQTVILENITTNSSGAPGSEILLSIEEKPNVTIEAASIEDYGQFNQTGTNLYSEQDADAEVGVSPNVEGEVNSNITLDVTLNTSTASGTAVYNITTYGTGFTPPSTSFTITNETVNDGESETDRILSVGEGDNEYDTIQTAVDNAEPGDQVQVASGTYSESVTVSVPNVTLVGPNAGTAGYADRPADEAVIQQGVEVNASNVTINGFEITNNDVNGLKISGAPSDVVITNNRVTEVGGGPVGKIKSTGNGINLQFNNAFRQTSTGITITNNHITNVTTDNTTGGQDADAIGIQVLPRGNDVEDLQITGNVISEIEPGNAPGDGRSEARAISIDTQFTDTSGGERGDFGQVANLSIKRNQIQYLNSEFSRAITLFEDKGGDTTTDDPLGPVNFTITSNTIANVTSTGEYPPEALFVGGYETFGQDHRVEYNNLLNVSIENFEEESHTPDPLNATRNWWGSVSGPAENAVVGSVNVNPWLDNRVDSGGDIFVAATIGKEPFSSIETAVEAADENDTIKILPGEYDEKITVDTPNVSIQGTGDDTVINGSVALSAPDTSLSDVQLNKSVKSKIFLDYGPAGSNNAINVVGNDVLVENVTINVEANLTQVDAGEYPEALGIEIAGDADDVDVSGNTIRVNVADANSEAGAVGVSVSDGSSAVVAENDIAVVSDGYGFATVARGSDTQVDIGFNKLSASGDAEELNGVGFGVEDGAVAARQDIRYNEFVSVDSIEHKTGTSTLDLTLNRWMNISEVEFITTGGGEIAYDPVLTTPVEDIDPNSLAQSIEYGSVLELNSDGSRSVAIGFSAPPDEPIGEIFDEINITGNAFVYNNEDSTYEDISGDYVPDVGEVVVFTTEDAVDERIIIPIETDIENEAATPESVSLNNGWNLVATGGTIGFSSATLDIAGAEVQNDLQLQAQPRQPGLPAEEADFSSDEYTGAFEATWIFVDDEPDSDAVLATGYAENQTAEEYVMEVLFPNEPQQYPPLPPRLPLQPYDNEEFRLTTVEISDR